MTPHAGFTVSLDVGWRGATRSNEINFKNGFSLMIIFSVCLAFPLDAPTLRLLCCTYGIPTKAPKFCSGPDHGPYGLSGVHLKFRCQTFTCTSTEVIQNSSHRLHSLLSYKMNQALESEIYPDLSVCA